MVRCKVAVVTPGRFVIPSVRSSSVERVVEQVVPLAQDAVDAVIFGTAGKGLPLKDEIEGVPCIRLPSGAFYLPSLIRRLRQWRPDIIEMNNRPAVAQKLRMHLPGARMVLNLHSSTYIRPPFIKPDQLEGMLKGVDGIIVNSGYVKEYIERHCSLSRPEILVNPLGVRLEHFVPRYAPASEALRAAKLRKYGWEGRKIILFTGRLIPEKGVHHLISVMPDILAIHPDALLLIVGSAGYSTDRETAYVRKLKAAAAPLGNRVAFVPFIPHPALGSWYLLADLVVVPSAARESFGLVNVEAMAAGVPVIATDAGGIPEIVEDGVSGLLIPGSRLPSGLAAPINQLLEDASLCRTMGLAGREKVRRQFRWELTAKRWAAFMQKLHHSERSGPVAP